MEEKNKFDTSDNLDDFDKMLFDYYDKQNDDIPFSTQLTIENALKNRRSEKSNYFSLLKKVAVFIACIGIVTATTVYAKDIVSFISNIFTNSNPGIDKAVENGYVQNVDMDFIVCNDVGVKVDYLLMDDHNLDISFVYKYFGEEGSIDSLIISNCSIKDENNNMLLWYSENPIPSDEDIILFDANIKFNSIEKNSDNNTIRTSLLLTSENFPTSHELTISISSIKLKNDKQSINIYGNWNFSISLDNKFVTRTNSEYYISNTSPYVNSVKTTLSNTSLTLELNLNVLLNEMNFLKLTNITLHDNNKINYSYTNLNIKNTSLVEPYSSIITLTYPISSYDNINFLFLHIQLTPEKSIDIELSK